MTDERRQDLERLVAEIDGVIAALEPHIRAETRAVAEERHSLGSFAAMADTSTLDLLHAAFDWLESAREALDDASM